MHGRTYVEKDIGLDLYRKKCMDLHQKKLQEIKNKNRKTEMKKVEEILNRKHQEKLRNFEFVKQEMNNSLCAERDLEVNRNNKKLLEKLVEISKGKHVSYIKSVKLLKLGVETLNPANHTASFTQSTQLFRPKSLNIVARKRESQKIEEDNFKFAKRLFESQGLISVKEMMKEFRMHSKIAKQVRKLHVSKGDRKGRHGLLPPLTLGANTVAQSTRLDEKKTARDERAATSDDKETKNDALNNVAQDDKNTQPEASTWVRDSHELFDYESPHLTKKTFKIQTSSGLLREETDVNMMTDKELLAINHHHGDGLNGKGPLAPLVFISQYRGFYSIFDQPHKIHHKSRKPLLVKPFPTAAQQTMIDKQQNNPQILKDEAHDQDANKLWLIVRYMTIDGKTNQFKLTGGETIKLGRVKFTIREIATAEDENQTDFDSFEEESQLNPEDLPFINSENRGLEQQMELSGMRHRQLQHFHSFEEEDFHLDQDEEEKKDSYASRDIRNTRVPNRHSRMLDENQVSRNRSMLEYEVFAGDSLEFQHKNPFIQEQLQDDYEPDHNEVDQSYTASLRDQEELAKTINTKRKGDSENQNLCRICFSEQYSQDNPLITPCKCSGSLKFIHLECLRTWLSRKENVKTTTYVISYSWKAFHCELCKSEYNDRVIVEGRQYYLFEIQKPKSNYVILESVQMQSTSGPQNQGSTYNQQTKTLHILNLNKKSTIKIGRGHDNDLRIADISVSRCHAFIKKDCKGNIILEDNQSKFGTLVQIKAPLLLREHLTYYIQAGRTIMKLQEQPEWSLLHGIMKSSSVNKRLDTDEAQRSFAQIDMTGDYFYDNIGKYCNSDAPRQFHQVGQSFVTQDEGENINDFSMDNAIPEEQKSNKGLHSRKNSKKISEKIQEIKKNEFKIKLTTLRDQYSNEKQTNQQYQLVESKSDQNIQFDGSQPVFNQQHQDFKVFSSMNVTDDQQITNIKISSPFSPQAQHHTLSKTLMPKSQIGQSLKQAISNVSNQKKGNKGKQTNVKSQNKQIITPKMNESNQRPNKSQDLYFSQEGEYTSHMNIRPSLPHNSTLSNNQLRSNMLSSPLSKTQRSPKLTQAPKTSLKAPLNPELQHSSANSRGTKKSGGDHKHSNSHHYGK